jgi:hypothetical protein
MLYAALILSDPMDESVCLGGAETAYKFRDLPSKSYSTLPFTCHPHLLPLYTMSESYTKDDPRLKEWLNIPGPPTESGKRLVTDVLVSTLAERDLTSAVQQ